MTEFISELLTTVIRNVQACLKQWQDKHVIWLLFFETVLSDSIIESAIAAVGYFELLRCTPNLIR